ERMQRTESGFLVPEVWESIQALEPWSGDWNTFDPADQLALLHRQARSAGFVIEMEQVGRSVECEPLWSVRFGTGERRVMIWARQHGNEPDCSAALAMAMQFLIR